MAKTRTVTVEIPEKEGPSIEPLMLSLDQAPQAIGVSRSMVCLLIKDGSLKSIKIGKRRLIPVTEIQAFIERQMEKGA